MVRYQGVWRFAFISWKVHPNVHTDLIPSIDFSSGSKESSVASKVLVDIPIYRFSPPPSHNWSNLDGSAGRKKR